MYFKATITKWEGLGKQNRVKDAVNGTAYLLNGNRVIGLQTRATTKSLFYYLDNPSDPREVISYIECEEDVVDIQTVVDLIFDSVFIPLPVYIDNDATQSIYDLYVNADTIILGDSYNPSPIDTTWITYQEGQKRKTVLVDYSIDDIISLGSYWTPQIPLGGETPNFWVKESTRNGLVLPDTVNPGSGDASILTPCFKTVDRTEKFFFASQQNAGKVYTIYFRARLDNSIYNAIGYYSSVEYATLFQQVERRWAHKPQSTACFGTTNCLDASLWTDNLFHDFCLVRNGTAVDFYVDEVKKGNTITMAANLDYLFTYFMNTSFNMAYIIECKIYKSIKTPALSKTDIPDFKWLIYTGYTCVEVISGEILGGFANNNLDNIHYSNEGSQYMLDYGYDYYLKNEIYAWARPVCVPHKIDGTSCTGGNLTAAGFRYLKDKSYLGDLTNHNLSDSMLYLPSVTMDRSNVTIWSDKAREATSLYDSLNPNYWNPLELNQYNINEWLNEDYKDIGFIKSNIDSINQQQNIQEIFCYNNRLQDSNLKKILQYTNDYDSMFNFFTHEAANIAMMSLVHPAAVYYNGKTYIVYQGNSVDSYIITYAHSTKIWSDPVLIGVNLGPDTDIGHASPSIVIDNLGYLHVFYGAHFTDILYKRSTNPENISSWDVMTSPGIGTFPQPIKFSDGTIYVFYTKGHPVNDNLWSIGYVKSDDGGDIFGAYVEVFQEFAFCYFCKGAGDVIHCFAHGYETTAYNKLHIYYARFEGGIWYDVNNNELVTPVVLSVTDIKIYDSGTAEITTVNCNYNDESMPGVVFSEGTNNLNGIPALGVHTYKYLRWNGVIFDVINLGVSTVLNTSAQGMALIKKENVLEYYMVVNQEQNESDAGGDILKYVSYDDGQTWTYEKTVMFNNKFVPSAVMNYIDENAKLVCGNIIGNDTSTWHNRAFLFGEKVTKNYKGKNW